MTLYFSRVHNSPLWPYETTKKLNSLNTKVMNNVNIKFKKAKNVLSILKLSGENLLEFTHDQKTKTL